jgi:predicted RNA-binding protein with PIN domain
VGRMPREQLPAALKKVAAFAPARRAKLGGSQIATTLENDPRFREDVSHQIRLQVPEVARALDAGTPPAMADPVELAATAFLLRTDGWSEVVTSVVDKLESGHAQALEHQAQAQLARLRRQLDQATEELRATRQKNRDRVSELKLENAELRRKLGDARTRAKAAEAGQQEAVQAAAEAVESAKTVAAGHETEVRRLRARVEELEGELTGLRRAERAGRGAEALRARLLLDTLLDTAQGLRRELALPAVEGAPADAVEAHVAEQGSRTHTSHGSLASDDPNLLDQLLTLPRAHLIVDGYNVTKTAWPELSLERQRDRLLAGVAPLVARSGAEVTVVFDAAETTERPLVNKPRGVRVLYSPVGVIADDVIRELVAAEPRGRPLVVVSSDQAVARDVVKAGARAVAAPALSRLLARA